MNDNLNALKKFERDGFILIDLADKYIDDFLSLNKKILNFSQKKLSKKISNLDELHRIKLNDLELNNYRMDLIKLINSQKNLKNNIYNSLDYFLDQCLGPDVVVQKNINLVIQKPKDKNRANFHKDAPMASNYELVVWIPLVDCYRTMSIYLFNINKHEKAKQLLSKQNSVKQFDQFSKKHGTLLDVKFGQAIIFWTNNYHYIPINNEKRTRWSLNLRYKNLFTQYGTKNFLDYYEILKLSPITKLLDKIDV